MVRLSLLRQTPRLQLHPPQDPSQLLNSIKAGFLDITQFSSHRVMCFFSSRPPHGTALPKPSCSFPRRLLHVFHRTCTTTLQSSPSLLSSRVTPTHHQSRTVVERGPCTKSQTPAILHVFQPHVYSLIPDDPLLFSPQVSSR